MRFLFVVTSGALLLVGCAGNTTTRSDAGAAPSSSQQASPDPSDAPTDRGTSMVAGRSPYSNARDKPVYPGFEALYGIQGTTMLLILVGKDGSPRDIKVERSAGWRTLDKSALNSANEWRYKPEIKNGVAVDSYLRVPVAFNDSLFGQPAWPEAYLAAPIVIDETPIPYASIGEAVKQVAALAGQRVYNGTGLQFHAYVIKDDQHVVREVWYFSDISTERAMAVRYQFTGTSDHPVTKASALCDNPKLCEQRMQWIMAGPYSIRTAAN